MWLTLQRQISGSLGLDWWLYRTRMLLISGITLVFLKPISVFCGAGNNEILIKQTMRYLFGIALGVPGTLLMAYLSPIIQLDGDHGKVKIATSVMMAVNLVGNLFAVLMLKSDTLGVGLSTAASYYAGCGVLLTHFMSKENHIRFSIRQFNQKYIGNVISTGSVSSLNKFMSAVLSFTVNKLLASFQILEAMAAFSLYKCKLPLKAIGGAK